MGQLFSELKRRNVIRVGAAYAVVGWVLVQVAGSLEEALSLPQWFDTVVVAFLGLGLPVALFLAWAYELTPDGVKKAEDVAAGESVTVATGQKLNYLIIGALVLALGYFIWERQALVVPTPDELTATVATATDARKSIAVLPFVNMSNDSEQEFFSDGISEELLNVLAKVGGLRVTSRTSAFAFKGSALSIPEVAAELGVQYILEGSVRRGGGQVRITTQLIDVETDSHLWSETYDRDISNIFAVQDEIAGHVADALKVALLGADDQPITPLAETSPDIYSDYLLARQKSATFQFEPMREAEGLLKGVIAADPVFVPAQEALAKLYLDMTEIGILSESKFVDLARPVIDSALSLDNRLAGVWLVNSYLQAFEGDYQQAQVSRLRARRLQPNHPANLRDQILEDTWARQPVDMEPVIRSLTAIDPYSALNKIYQNLWYHRVSRFEEMRRSVARLSEIIPGGAMSLFWPVIIPLPEQDNAAKIETSRLLRQGEPGDPEVPAFLALNLLDAGEVNGVDQQIRDARALDPDHAFVAIADALYKSYNGDTAGALEIAENLAGPKAPTRWGSRDIALRMLSTEALASGDPAALIPQYLAVYPGLVDSNLDSINVPSAFYVKWGHLMAALDLAVLYKEAGEGEKSDALLAAVEAELPFWPRRGVFGIGIADAELQAIRGNDAAALAALRQALADGWTQNWWWFLDHSPHFEHLRSMPEFAEIRAGFAASAALHHGEGGE